MKKLVFSFVSFLFFHSLIFLEAQSKGAIIIASLEGDVSIVNNETQTPVAADQVRPGGLILMDIPLKRVPPQKLFCSCQMERSQLLNLIQR